MAIIASHANTFQILNSNGFVHLHTTTAVLSALNLCALRHAPTHAHESFYAI